MDGPHDLGGREGFGPIEMEDDYRPFHEDWEGPAFAMLLSAGGHAGWTIDWFRHCRELIAPVDYLERPYFDQWVQTLTAQMIDSGYLTLEEIVSGRSERATEPDVPPASAASAKARVANPASFEREIDTAPRFAVGDRVTTRRFGHSGHTRLPGYARGRAGIVHAHHGAHILPDASAQGEKLAEHLYTVAFEASELWGEAQGRRDRVFIDLWESYLEQP